MIARFVTILAAVYLALVMAGVALVSTLQTSIGYLPALGAALALFLGVAWGAALLIRRRLARYRSLLGAYQASMMRPGGRL